MVHSLFWNAGCLNFSRSFCLEPNRYEYLLYFDAEQKIKTKWFRCLAFGYLDIMKLDCFILQIAIKMNIFLRYYILLYYIWLYTFIVKISLFCEWPLKLQNKDSWTSGLITNVNSTSFKSQGVLVLLQSGERWEDAEIMTIKCL